MRRLLIVGCGDVARRALPWLTRRFRVFALVRDRADAAGLRALGVTPLWGDLDDAASLRRLGGIAHCLMHFAPPPDQGEGDPRTARLIAALSRPGSVPQRVVYISTTGVYGDCGGALADESRPLRPTTARARRRADAERRLRRFGRGRGVAVAILRAPGIYGADRLPLPRIRRGDPVLRPEDDVHTNHIHAEDLARAACLALHRGTAGRVYNACDDSDLAMGEYFDQVADAFGLPRPPRISRSEVQGRLSPVTLSFMGESRRLANRRLKGELRFRFRYPDVGAGLAAARQEKKDC